MSDYIRCPGTLSQAPDGAPLCSAAWEIIPSSTVESIFQALTISEASTIAAAIATLWAVAFGVRVLVNFTISTGPGRN